MMNAAIVGLVVLGTLFVGWDVHQGASIEGVGTVSCDAEGSVTVDETKPTEPDVQPGNPGCSGPA